jgi:hypothetical protein
MRGIKVTARRFVASTDHVIGTYPWVRLTYDAVYVPGANGTLMQLARYESDYWRVNGLNSGTPWSDIMIEVAEIEPPQPNRSDWA